jgi:hypothetical protein
MYTQYWSTCADVTGKRHQLMTSHVHGDDVTGLCHTLSRVDDTMMTTQLHVTHDDVTRHARQKCVRDFEPPILSSCNKT